MHFVLQGKINYLLTFFWTIFFIEENDNKFDLYNLQDI